MIQTHLLLNNINDRIYECFKNNLSNKFLCTKKYSKYQNQPNLDFVKTIIVPAYFPIIFDKIYLSYSLQKKLAVEIE